MFSGCVAGVEALRDVFVPEKALEKQESGPLDLETLSHSFARGIADQQGRGCLQEAISGLVDSYGLDPKFAQGVMKCVLRHALIRRGEDLPGLDLLLAPMADTCAGVEIRHAANFSYLPNFQLPRMCVLDCAGKNARFMLESFGASFFSGRVPVYYQSPIGNGPYCLSCIGGSGAGTFSLNFSIGIKKGYLPTGQLWRMGVDFQCIGGKIGMRIILNGSECRKNDPAIEEKRKGFSHFRRAYGVSPQRALGFLLLQLAYDLHVDSVMALSTIGARKLSTLSRTRTGARYTELFHGLGFGDTVDECWHGLDSFQEAFFSTQCCSRDELIDGMEAYEAAGVGEVYDALFQLKSSLGSRPFPLRTEERMDKETEEGILSAALKRGKYLDHHSFYGLL